LLDEPNRGAANPWGAAWADDGNTLVVTSKNRQDQHGTTSTLTGKEIDDLCEYLLSL